MLQQRITKSSSNFVTAAVHRFAGQRSNVLSQTFGTTASVAADQEPQEPSVVDDSFRIFGFPRQFNISSSELKQKYHQLMTKYHPDKHRDASASDRNVTDEKAAGITHAFQTLRHPHTRASHLLELLGTPMDETSSTDLVGMEFLTDVMEVRESVDSTSADHLQPLWKETKLSIESLIGDLTIAFDEDDLDKAIELAARLQYWHRIESAIREKMSLE